jgi:hypothetical protein
MGRQEDDDGSWREPYHNDIDNKPPFSTVA